MAVGRCVRDGRRSISVFCVVATVMDFISFHRLKGWYMWLLGVVFAICSVFCVVATVMDFARLVDRGPTI